MIEESKKVWMRGNPSNPKGIITTLQSYGGWYDGSFDDSLSISGMVFYIDHNSKITMINPIRVEAQCIMECYQEIKLFCDGDILQAPDGCMFIFDGERVLNESLSCHCGINSKGELQMFFDKVIPVRWCSCDESLITYATTENRDILLKRLKEEGYECELGNYGKRVTNIFKVKTYDDLLSHKLPNPSDNEKLQKHHEAVTKITMLLPYYGGEISDQEWNNIDQEKFIIQYSNKFKSLIVTKSSDIRCLLAFHTFERAKDFMENNRELIRNYYLL